ncbi:cofilin/actin-depolymerizing factor homolog-related [Anaeramoeba flamelloides]|uniref:Cofilin/actin-depolymerizing factor homolog-related n=1 Tax=Anaeramoeba flamelloides TaxID=1746091 RepID=A0AAV7Z970_9EUKA|nr:cofilin/actin-depolymerizing factor homolog-related [Anaeramoeba flamelloides]KAJ6226014.1 cofilin/actin-depolymerizing factor homolog-related [Anaeramoeba flamelloides]
MTGILPTNECLEQFQEFKFSKEDRFIIYKMDEKLSKIEVEKRGTKKESFEEFYNQLPQDDCRYICYHFDFDVEGQKRSKLLFIGWVPSTAKLKNKMVYATTLLSFKYMLRGIGVSLQINNTTDLTEELILEVIMSKVRK